MTAVLAPPAQRVACGAVGGAADADLRARLLAGDDEALARIVDQHGAMVYGLARRVTGDNGAAEDVAQDVFVTLWERPDRFDPDAGTLYTFLAVLTRRRAIDWLRRRATAARHLTRLATAAVDPVDVAALTTARLDAAAVRRAVDDLPTDQRAAVELAYFDGLTFTQVATRLGIPEGTAKSRLRLGLSRLARLLAAQTGTAGEVRS